MRAGVAHCVIAAAAAALAGACTRDPAVTTAGAMSVGHWRVERQVDRIAGVPLASAFVMATRSSNSFVDFPRPAGMQVACFKEQPLIRFAFEFKIGSDRNSLLGYRFDDRPGREARARFLQNGMIVVIEDPAEAATFLQEMASAKQLYILIRSLNSGRSSAEFQIEGAARAIETALAACYPAADKAGRAGA